MSPTPMPGAGAAVGNDRDTRTETGFQFEFVCERCGTGYQRARRRDTFGARAASAFLTWPDTGATQNRLWPHDLYRPSNLSPPVKYNTLAAVFDSSARERPAARQFAV